MFCRPDSLSFLEELVCDPNWDPENSLMLGGDSMMGCMGAYLANAIILTVLLYTVREIARNCGGGPCPAGSGGRGKSCGSGGRGGSGGGSGGPRADNAAQFVDQLAYDLAKTAYVGDNADRCIALVKKYCIDVNKPAPDSGLTLFLCACLSGDPYLVCYLLENGADINTCTKEMDGPLYLATYGYLCSPCPDLKVIKSLICAGCDVNRQNSCGFTPLHQACSKGDFNLTKFLLCKDADASIANSEGVFPIQMASSEGHARVVDLVAHYMPSDDAL